ncbi:hypothetical protein GCM10027167_46330 [Nocardia heshunensis]
MRRSEQTINSAQQIILDHPILLRRSDSASTVCHSTFGWARSGQEAAFGGGGYGGGSGVYAEFVVDAA